MIYLPRSDGACCRFSTWVNFGFGAILHTYNESNTQMATRLSESILDQPSKHDTVSDMGTEIRSKNDASAPKRSAVAGLGFSANSQVRMKRNVPRIVNPNHSSTVSGQTHHSRGSRVEL